MELTERIRYVMKINNMTASKFADEIGVQRSSVSHILSGRNKPSLDFIVKILERFPNVSPAWLLLGKTDVNPVEKELFTNVKEDSEREQTLSENPNVTNVNNRGGVEHKGSEEGIDTIVNNVNKPENAEKIVFFFPDGTFKAYSPQE